MRLDRIASGPLVSPSWGRRCGVWDHYSRSFHTDRIAARIVQHAFSVCVNLVSLLVYTNRSAAASVERHVRPATLLIHITTLRARFLVMFLRGCVRVRNCSHTYTMGLALWLAAHTDDAQEFRRRSRNALLVKDDIGRARCCSKTLSRCFSACSTPLLSQFRAVRCERWTCVRLHEKHGRFRAMQPWGNSW